jgi:polysaccharide biosynthesis protein PslH
MRILAVSTWFPYPPDNGARARAYNLLRGIGGRHTLDLIAMSQSERDGRYLDNVREFCHRVAIFKEPAFDPASLSGWRGFLSPVPRYFIEHHLPEMERLAMQWVQQAGYDAVVAVTLGAAPYVAGLDVRLKVLDQHNVECAVIRRQSRNEPTFLRRLRYVPTWIKAERFERRVVSAFDAVAVVSEPERALMKTVLRGNAGADIRVIPNGVDPALLEYDLPAKDPRMLVFTGALTYKPNYHAALVLCREVLPVVRAELGDVRLRITGSTSGVDTSPFSAVDGVEFTGYVEDIRPVLGAASALVVPLKFGGGTRIKILEAMAIGTPVVSTPMGAEGIEAEDGVHLLLGETVHDVARQTCRLLSDPALGQALARNARDLVRDRYQWPTIADRFELIFAEKGGRTKWR